VVAWDRLEELFGADTTAAFARLRARFQPLLVRGDTTPAAEALAAGETPLRSGNGHASIHRTHLVEKTLRFERR
jgi:hypothetical protein